MTSPSYLSSERDVKTQNHCGFFNLLLVILVVSNFRLLLDAVSRHGFILTKIATLRDFRIAPLADFPFVSGLLIVQAFVVGAYIIKKILSRNWVNEQVGLALHFVNTCPLAWSWRMVPHQSSRHRRDTDTPGNNNVAEIDLVRARQPRSPHDVSEKHGSNNMLALVKDLDLGDESISVNIVTVVDFIDIFFGS